MSSNTPWFFNGIRIAHHRDDRPGDRAGARAHHALAATRTTIDQARADETTAGLRPNPGLSADWQVLPWPSSLDGDVGLSFTLQRGGKRGRRQKAAKDATAVTRSQVADAERTVTFQVASQFIAAQLAESAFRIEPGSGVASGDEGLASVSNMASSSATARSLCLPCCPAIARQGNDKIASGSDQPVRTSHDLHRGTDRRQLLFSQYP